MWRDEATLLDIALAARRISAFVKDVNETSFAANEEKQWVVVAQLLVIGEAAVRLSDEFKSSHPAIAWARITGMRNRLIHGYDKIRWEVVWRTATEAVPQLLEQIEPLLPTKESP